MPEEASLADKINLMRAFSLLNPDAEVLTSGDVTYTLEALIREAEEATEVGKYAVDAWFKLAQSTELNRAAAEVQRLEAELDRLSEPEQRTYLSGYLAGRSLTTANAGHDAVTGEPGEDLRVLQMMMDINWACSAPVKEYLQIKLRELDMQPEQAMIKHLY